MVKTRKEGEVRSFTKKMIAQDLNMEPSTVAYYTEQGLISPDVYNPKKRGSTNLYSKRNLVEFLLIKRLVELGIRIQEIKTDLPWLNDMCESPGQGISAEEFSKARPGSLGFDALDPDDPENLKHDVYLKFFKSDNVRGFEMRGFDKSKRNYCEEMEVMFFIRDDILAKTTRITLINISELVETVRRI